MSPEIRRVIGAAAAVLTLIGGCSNPRETPAIAKIEQSSVIPLGQFIKNLPHSAPFSINGIPPLADYIPDAPNDSSLVRVHNFIEGVEINTEALQQAFSFFQSPETSATLGSEIQDEVHNITFTLTPKKNSKFRYLHC